MTKTQRKYNAYKHTPIAGNHSIRLLSLQPSLTFKSPIHITLEEVSLDGIRDYEALSYSWESQTLGCPVLCYGSQLLITKNCRDALRRLREKFKPRLLWIDSICIDQTCIEEREQQVQLMGDVYSKAKMVLIWLGESTELSDAFLSLLISYQKIKTSENRILAQFHRPLMKLKNLSIKAKVKKFEHNNRSSFEILSSITSRSWFGRAWTVQEYILSNDATFVCGGASMNTRSFFSALSAIEEILGKNRVKLGQVDIAKFMIESMAFLTYEGFFSPLRDQLSGEGSEEPDTFTDLLAYTRRMGATDPKDKVFGLYGILKILDVSMPSPCYEDPIEIIYTEATKAAIEHDKSLIVFLEVARDNEPTPFPSWVPNWSVSVIYGFSTIASEFSIAVFNASKTSKASFWFPEQGNLLGVRGILVSTIAESFTGQVLDVIDNVPQKEVVSRFRDVLKEWVTFTKDLQPYPMEEAWEDVLFCTLENRATATLDQEQDVEEKTNFLNCIESLFPRGPVPVTQRSTLRVTKAPTSRKLLESKSSSETAIQKDVEEQTGVGAGKWELNSMLNMIGMRLFKTASGHLGKGLASMRDGDAVLLIAGVPLPMLARAKGDTYELIGPCYVYGMADGEFWPEDEKELVDIIIS